MGHIINPILYRLNVVYYWNSIFYINKNFYDYLTVSSKYIFIFVKHYFRNYGFQHNWKLYLYNFIFIQYYKKIFFFFFFNTYRHYKIEINADYVDRWFFMKKKLNSFLFFKFKNIFKNSLLFKYKNNFNNIKNILNLKINLMYGLNYKFNYKFNKIYLKNKKFKINLNKFLYYIKIDDKFKYNTLRSIKYFNFIFLNNNLLINFKRYVDNLKNKTKNISNKYSNFIVDYTNNFVFCKNILLRSNFNYLNVYYKSLYYLINFNFFKKKNNFFKRKFNNVNFMLPKIFNSSGLKNIYKKHQELDIYDFIEKNFHFKNNGYNKIYANTFNFLYKNDLDGEYIEKNNELFLKNKILKKIKKFSKNIIKIEIKELKEKIKDLRKIVVKKLKELKWKKFIEEHKKNSNYLFKPPTIMHILYNSNTFYYNYYNNFKNNFLSLKFKNLNLKIKKNYVFKKYFCFKQKKNFDNLNYFNENFNNLNFLSKKNLKIKTFDLKKKNFFGKKPKKYNKKIRKKIYKTFKTFKKVNNIFKNKIFTINFNSNFYYKNKKKIKNTFYIDYCRFNKKIFNISNKRQMLIYKTFKYYYINFLYKLRKKNFFKFSIYNNFKNLYKNNMFVRSFKWNYLNIFKLNKRNNFINFRSDFFKNYFRKKYKYKHNYYSKIYRKIIYLKEEKPLREYFSLLNLKNFVNDKFVFFNNKIYKYFLKKKKTKKYLKTFFFNTFVKIKSFVIDKYLNYIQTKFLKFKFHDNFYDYKQLNKNFKKDILNVYSLKNIKRFQIYFLKLFFILPSFMKLKSNFLNLLYIYYKKNKNINLVLLFVRKRSDLINADLACDYIILKLLQKFTLKELMWPLLKVYQKCVKINVLTGYRLLIMGRLTRKDRALFKWYKVGPLPLSTRIAPIDYANRQVALKYSLCSMKIWLMCSKNYKRTKKVSAIPIPLYKTNY